MKKKKKKLKSCLRKYHMGSEVQDNICSET